MTRAAALLVLLAAAASASAGDEAPGVRKAVADALGRGDRAAALAALDAVAEPGATPNRRKLVEAARAALDLVGGPEGNVRAARIVVLALKLDKSDADGAYTLAMDLRRRFWDMDPAAETELLRGFVVLFPATLEFNDDLARQYRHAGRSDLALAQYEKMKDLAKSDRACRYELALLHELRGALDDAEKEYDELIALPAADENPEFRAHLAKAQLLLWKRHDVAAAVRAIDVGETAAQAASPGRERDGYLASFKGLREDVADEERSRGELRALRGSLHAALGWTAAAWLVVLGGGVLLLRRAKWI